MLEIIKSVISAGGYKLADIQHKIRKLYVLGDLTEAEMDALLALAPSGVCADAERPDTLQMIMALSSEIDALKARVTVLEGGEDKQTEHPVWKPWDGISKDYQKGTVVTHNGQLWESILDGQNVWEPGAPGTECMWKSHENSKGGSL